MSLNNVPVITTGQIVDVMHEAWKMRMPVMLWGEPGIGKSQAVSASIKQIMEREGLPDFGFIDRRLSQYEPVEIRGIPMVTSPRKIYEDLQAFLDLRRRNRTGTISGAEVGLDGAIDLMNASVDHDALEDEIRQRMKHLAKEMSLGNAYAEWSRPDILPRVDKHGEHGIVFLDELPNAPMDVQAPAYQLILDRALGDHSLPPGWVVAAAGNRIEDRSGVYEMSFALANRFTHFNVSFSFEDWLNWAYASNINPQVIAYHRFHAGRYMFMFDPSKDDRAFATPRSWESVSRIMSSVGMPELRRAYIGGRVGVPIATEFTVFCSLQETLPDIDKIISEWNTPSRYKFPKIGEQIVKHIEEIIVDDSPAEQGADGDEYDHATNRPTKGSGKPIKHTRTITVDSVSLSYMIIAAIPSRINEKTISTIWDIIDHLTNSDEGGFKEIGFALLMDCMRKDKVAITEFGNHKKGDRFAAWGLKNAELVKP